VVFRPQIGANLDLGGRRIDPFEAGAGLAWPRLTQMGEGSMGLMDRYKDAAGQAKQAMGSSNLGAGDMGEMMEMQKRYQRLNELGIQRRATIESLSETGRRDMGGSPEYEFALTIAGEGGDAYQATIKQFMHPDQLQHFPAGKEVGVKVDPDDPTVAVLWG
jgi:hypothetical protein